MELNKYLLNIYQLTALLFDIGVKIALTFGNKGNSDRFFRGNQHSKVIPCSDRYANFEEMLRETKYV